jgi:hypothetical protein
MIRNNKVNSSHTKNLAIANTYIKNKNNDDIEK